ncbi:MAG TPA: histidinol-phosphate transaminase [Cellvibrionaceae bacterium]
MSRFWSRVIREIEPYVPGEQPQIDGLIKLNTNESPYPPSPRVHEVLSGDDPDKLKLYPDPDARELRQTLADYYQLPLASVFVGNGSDEVLAEMFMAFFQQDQPILFPDITYSFYQVYCQLFSIQSEQVPLADDFSINLDDYAKPCGGVIFPNPNAPTGVPLSLSAIRDFAANNSDTLVVVDEAYIDFGGESAVALVPEFDNILVVQTLSKSRSLAGIRVGFAIGHADLISGLERVKNSFNSYPLDRLAQLAARVAIEDDAYFRECCDRVMNTRQHTAQALTELGFSVLPSAANFVLARPPAGVDASNVMQQLRERKIIVRHFNKPRIKDYLRITIGTDAQMARLIEVLTDLLQTP